MGFKKSEVFGICGRVDASDSETIFEFKVSGKTHPTSDWKVQALTYACLSSTNVKRITIVNFTSGVSYSWVLPDTFPEVHRVVVLDKLLKNAKFPSDVREALKACAMSMR